MVVGLGGGAAAEEQHRVVGRNRHQRTQVGLGLGRDLDELRPTVTVFDDGSAGIAPFQHLVLGLAEDALGQGGGTGERQDQRGLSGEGKRGGDRRRGGRTRGRHMHFDQGLAVSYQPEIRVGGFEHMALAKVNRIDGLGLREGSTQREGKDGNGFHDYC